VKIIIAGGGTGGHLYPGIAVAEEFIKRGSEKTGQGQKKQKTNFFVQISKENIIFVGTIKGIESKVIPKEGFNIKFLRAEGVIGKSFLKKIKALFIFLLSLFDAYKILKETRPDIVIGVGGYASVSIVLVASLLRIPTIILEQNTTPGLANRILSRFVDAIAITYQESMLFFPKNKIFLTGNPIREKVLKGNAALAYKIFSLNEDKFKIFIFGGSLGASSINNYVCEALNHLLDLRKKIQFLHQTGEKDYEKVKNVYNKLGFKGVVLPYIYEMAEAYKIADIVISRAGASTLSEITALGKPAILIPYPYAASNHQEKNARKLQEIGAARMILEKDLSAEVLAKAIRELFENERLRKDMQKIAAAFGKINAAAEVVDIAFSLIKKRNKMPLAPSSSLSL
jgi:UDP-N-acetylglucosamine--N-acetylmuramyl-(pentapeptide) pyrophosphoryl-undecaprenol N-acetylglucosamine transferase